MLVKVIGAQKMVFEGEAYGIKAIAPDGEFMCLDHHIDFLTVVNPGELTILSKEDGNQKPLEKYVLTKKALLSVEQNIATIIL